MLVVLVSILVAVGLGSFILSFFGKKLPPNVPNGSMGWLPLLGETLIFLKPHKANTLGQFLEERCARYGKIFRSHLFGSPAVVSCDHELNTFILQNEEKLFLPSYPTAVHKILGEQSMAFVTGDLHRRLRTSALGFTRSRKTRQEFLYDVDNLITTTLNSWKNKKQLIMYNEARNFTFHLIARQVLSLEPGDEHLSLLLQNYIICMTGFKYLPISIPGTSFAKALKARKKIDSILNKLMKERRDNPGDKDDYLNAILADTSLNEKDKVGVLFDLMLAGHESSGILISLLVYFLAQHPHVLDKLKEEQQGIKDRKVAGEPLNWDDFSQMEFTLNVIHEALRCANIVRFLHRKALQDINFKGYLIPAGWLVVPMIAAVHLDPDLYKNPSEFNPWRWTGNEKGRILTPFSGGPRLCPGADVAKMEASFFLHHFVLNFRWKTKESEFPLAHPYVHFKDDLKIEIEPIS